MYVLWINLLLYGLLQNDVMADQICESVSGVCPADTCCRQDKCDLEGNGIRCCTGSESANDCSDCPLCRDCQWSEWSTPKKVSPESCGDGKQPRKQVGEVTRKYITYSDGSIKSPGGKCDDLRTKMTWEKDCPEHCQLSECVWSEWSESCPSRRNCTRTKINPDLPKFGGRSCEEEAGCKGTDCWQSQTENKTCGVCGTGCQIGIVSAIVIAIAAGLAYMKYKNRRGRGRGSGIGGPGGIGRGGGTPSPRDPTECPLKQNTPTPSSPLTHQGQALEQQQAMQGQNSPAGMAPPQPGQQPPPGAVPPNQGQVNGQRQPASQQPGQAPPQQQGAKPLQQPQAAPQQQPAMPIGQPQQAGQPPQQLCPQQQGACPQGAPQQGALPQGPQQGARPQGAPQQGAPRPQQPGQPQGARPGQPQAAGQPQPAAPAQQQQAKVPQQQPQSGAAPQGVQGAKPSDGQLL